MTTNVVPRHEPGAVRPRDSDNGDRRRGETGIKINIGLMCRLLLRMPVSGMDETGECDDRPGFAPTADVL